MKTSHPYNYLKIKYYFEQEMYLDGLSDGRIYASLNIGQTSLVDFPEYAIDLQELYNSTKKSGEYFILTCECGDPDDIGILKGIEVTHFEQYIQWYIFEPEPQRIFNFKTEHYLEEIEKALTTFTHIFQKYKLEINEGTIRTIPFRDHIQNSYKFLKQKRRKI